MKPRAWGVKTSESNRRRDGQERHREGQADWEVVQRRTVGEY